MFSAVVAMGTVSTEVGSIVNPEFEKFFSGVFLLFEDFGDDFLGFVIVSDFFGVRYGITFASQELEAIIGDDDVIFDCFLDLIDGDDGLWLEECEGGIPFIMTGEIVAFEVAVIDDADFVVVEDFTVQRGEGVVSEDEPIHGFSLIAGEEGSGRVVFRPRRVEIQDLHTGPQPAFTQHVIQFIDLIVANHGNP